MSTSECHDLDGVLPPYNSHDLAADRESNSVADVNTNACAGADSGCR
jgi:hypothetical protein